jgi:hypothetical protein
MVGEEVPRAWGGGTPRREWGDDSRRFRPFKFIPASSVDEGGDEAAAAEGCGCGVRRDAERLRVQGVGSPG